MSPVMTRARTSTGAGVIAMLVLVLAFGNQAYVEWAANHAQGANAWDLLLRTLAWPKWFITSGGNASRDVIAFDIRALLLDRVRRGHARHGRRERARGFAAPSSSAGSR